MRTFMGLFVIPGALLLAAGISQVAQPVRGYLVVFLLVALILGGLATRLYKCHAAIRIAEAQHARRTGRNAVRERKGRRGLAAATGLQIIEDHQAAGQHRL